MKEMGRELMVSCGLLCPQMEHQVVVLILFGCILLDIRFQADYFSSVYSKYDE
jgi:hypothetical protein